MDIIDVEAFVSLARTLNFTKSAEMMFVSQSSFSRRISLLEEELGVTLFLRDRRSVALTSEGQLLLKDAIALVEQYQATMYRMRKVKKEENGCIRIGFLDHEGTEILVEGIHRFREKHPDINVNLTDYDETEIRNALLSGKIDFAYMAKNEIDFVENIHYAELFSAKMCIAAKKGTPLSQKDYISIKDLSEESFIMVNREKVRKGAAELNRFCLRDGLNPKISSYVEKFYNIPLLVECEKGIAFLPESANHNIPDNICLIPLKEPELLATTVIAWVNEKTDSFQDEFVNGLIELSKNKWGERKWIYQT